MTRTVECVCVVTFSMWIWLDFDLTVWENSAESQFNLQLETPSNCFFSAIPLFFCTLLFLAQSSSVFFIYIRCKIWYCFLFRFLLLLLNVITEKVGAGIANDRLVECSNFLSILWKLIAIGTNLYTCYSVCWQDDHYYKRKREMCVNSWNFKWEEKKNVTCFTNDYIPYNHCIKFVPAYKQTQIDMWTISSSNISIPSKYAFRIEKN